MNTEAGFMNVQFVEVSEHNLESFFKLEVSVYNVYSTLQISVKPLLLKDGGVESVNRGDCK